MNEAEPNQETTDDLPLVQADPTLPNSLTNLSISEKDGPSLTMPSDEEPGVNTVVLNEILTKEVAGKNVVLDLDGENTIDGGDVEATGQSCSETDVSIHVPIRTWKRKARKQTNVSPDVVEFGLGKRVAPWEMDIDVVNGKKKNKQIDAVISANTTAGPGIQACRDQ